MKMLCAEGKAALDEMPLTEAVIVAERILRQLQGRCSRGLLAGAGLALLAAGPCFSLSRGLFKVFEAIEKATGRPVEELAELGSQLPAQQARVLLAYLAGCSSLDERTRGLAREAADLQPRLVFDALRGRLPESLSLRCSPALREDFLELHLLLQPRPRVSWSLRLRSWARGWLAAAA